LNPYIDGDTIMQFLDSSVPIATCEASGCEGCSVAESVQCHFGPGDLFHFYLICFPAFLVGGAGILAVGWLPLIAWLLIIFSFFVFIEIRVMCSHCPHYAEDGPTLRCWANYGSPKLWRYRPGPMSTAEKVVFFAGLAVVWGYPLAFLVAAGLWFLLILYVLLTTSFAASLKRFLCSRCMNFACPLNSVPEQARALFWERNPRIRDAWEAGS
jgi:hypothetical protein